MNLLIFQLDWLKTSAVWLVSVIGGVWFALETQPAQWLEPAIVQTLITTAVVVIFKIAERRWNKADKQSAEEKEAAAAHLTMSDKIAELTLTERRELLGGLNSLHEKELTFLKAQLTVEKVSNFEARTRAHRAINETHHLTGHIYVLHAQMSQKGVEIPEFKPRSYDEIMYGVSDEIEKFKETLETQIEQIKV